MSRESTCRCLICDLERRLTEQLSEYQCQERYREFAASHSLLSPFPAATDLVTYLHSCRNSSNGTYAADGILTELLQTSALDGNGGTLRDLLLLVFVPTLHSTSRQVAGRYPSVLTDDIAQHVVASLLQILNSPEFYGRRSHAAFAISRMLKRHAFEWAERECRSPVYTASPETLSETPSSSDTAEPVERSAVLRHFLHRCHQRGQLTGEDLALLVQFKLDTPRDTGPGGPAVLYSNAPRQRMKRLLYKLRLIARAPRSRKQHADQLRLF
jgi:hypothetical protein